MKKFISIALVFCLALTAFIFVGCSNENNRIKLEGGPEITELVTGNGSFQIRKGDYIYFASGYVASSDLGTGGLTNELGKVSNGALYRAKIELKKTLIEKEDKKEGEEDQYKEEYVLSEVQLLCSKVVGFENSGLYIFGNKIYFGTPSTIKNSEGKVMYSLLTFYSVDLDGQNLTEIYQTTEFSSGSYSFISINGNLYLLIFDGSKILRVDMNGNSKVLATDVKSAVLPKSIVVAENSYSATENEKYIYYTIANNKNTDTRDYGNVLCKANIISGEATELFKEDYLTITLSKFENDKLYYKRNVLLSEMSPSSESYLFVNDLTGKTFQDSEKQLTSQSAISTMIEFKYEADNYDGYVYVNGGKLYYRSNDGLTTKQLSSSASSAVFVQGKYVYYVSSSALYRVDVTKETPSGEKLSDSNTINTTYFDIDSNFAYFYVKNSSTSKYETYYIDLINFVSGTTKPVKAVA